jgi:hypothetical protein
MHTYCSHFSSMADLDIVQVSDPNVVQATAPEAAAGVRRRRTRTLPLLCFARDQQARQHAVAFLLCAPFVMLPEQVATAEQTQLRQTNLDYKPAYYVDYCVTSVVPFDVPFVFGVAARSPTYLGFLGEWRSTITRGLPTGATTTFGFSGDCQHAYPGDQRHHCGP